MEKNKLEVASAAATENYFSRKITKIYRHKWKIIKDFFLLFFGQSYFSVESMYNVMFPFWKKFSEKNFQKYKDHIEEGIVGSNVIMKKTALDKIGFWDEKIQLADLDLFYRTKKRSLEVGDIKPVHILDGVFLLHYLRLTLGKKNRWRNPVNFKDKNNLILLEQKYSKEEILKYDTRRICD
jgi:GT2 family glycosyltransferase